MFMIYGIARFLCRAAQQQRDIRPRSERDVINLFSYLRKVLWRLQEYIC